MPGVSEADVKWLYELYGFLKEGQTSEDEDDCTIGWEGEKMIVDVFRLRKGLKCLFILLKDLERLSDMLPSNYLFQ